MKKKISPSTRTVTARTRKLVIVLICAVVLAGGLYTGHRFVERQVQGALDAFLGARNYSYDSLSIHFFQGKLRFENMKVVKDNVLVSADSIVIEASGTGVIDILSVEQIKLSSQNIALLGAEIQASFSGVEAELFLDTPQSLLAPVQDVYEYVSYLTCGVTSVDFEVSDVKGSMAYGHVLYTPRTRTLVIDGRMVKASGMSWNGHIIRDLALQELDISLFHSTGPAVSGRGDTYSLGLENINIAVENISGLFSESNQWKAGTMRIKSVDPGWLTLQPFASLQIPVGAISMEKVEFSIGQDAVSQAFQNSGIGFLTSYAPFFLKYLQEVSQIELEWEQEETDWLYRVTSCKTPLLALVGAVSRTGNLIDGRIEVSALQRDVRSVLSLIFPFAFGQRFPSSEDVVLIFDYDIQHQRLMHVEAEEKK